MMQNEKDVREAIQRAVAAARAAVAQREMHGGSCNYDDMEGGVDPKLTKLGRPNINSKDSLKHRQITRGHNKLSGKYSIAEKVAAKGALQDPKNRKYAIYVQKQAGGRFEALFAGEPRQIVVRVKGVAKNVLAKRPRVVVGTPLSAAKKAIGILHKTYSRDIKHYVNRKDGKERNPVRRVSAEALVESSSAEKPVHFKLVEITKGVRHTSKGKRVAVNGTANFVYEFYGWQEDAQSGLSRPIGNGKVIAIKHKNVAFRVANKNSGKPYEALHAIYKKRAAAASVRANKVVASRK